MTSCSRNKIRIGCPLRYPLPACCRTWCWCILCLLIVAVYPLVLAYSLTFDMELETSINYMNPNYDDYPTDCWNTSLRSRIEAKLSIDGLAEAFPDQQEMNETAYGLSEAGSWVVFILQSILLSWCLWQPLNSMAISILFMSRLYSWILRLCSQCIW